MRGMTDKRLAVCALRRCAMLLALALVASGCTTIYEGKYAYDGGWRIGEIEKIGTKADLKTFGLLCRRTESVEGHEADRFAYVQFVFGPMAGKYMYNGPRQRHVIVPLPAGSQLKEGAQVYVNIQDCGQPAIPANQLRP